jgi:hypothetical protein
MADQPIVRNDGYGKVELAKRYSKRGAVNRASQVVTRPAGPAPMKPATASGNAPATQTTVKPK